MSDPETVDRAELLAAFSGLGIDLTDVRYLTADHEVIVLQRAHRDHEGRMVSDGTGQPVTIQSSIRISPHTAADAP